MNKYLLMLITFSFMNKYLLMLITFSFILFTFCNIVLLFLFPRKKIILCCRHVVYSRVYVMQCTRKELGIQEYI
ncbi:hypothetical protein L2E82_15272 [Cichorium intybus]|uniref:Uncharacterized protein n=1 Tax=Cichorium intybus TaxID=13427 RepID=A0ACB9F296_CICIN|nr:hypothetical protein L2E82_15272 [Cichorium intybus]